MSNAGASNPNWRGGLLQKRCAVCAKPYQVKRVHSASRFCSLQCVGISQRGAAKPRKPKVVKICATCGVQFEVYPAHAPRVHCCSKACSHQRRSAMTAGSANPSWAGGVSRLPYPWNFRDISRHIIARDGEQCQNPACPGNDPRMTAHHINYDKTDCRPENLICLCSACNSRANYRRDQWSEFYSRLVADRLEGGL